MLVVHTRAELAAARAGLTAKVGLVPTMGALHDGHLALLRHSRGACAALAATIFVNPAQFGPGEDLARYPRTLDADLEICERAGVDLVWAPPIDEVYPAGEAQVTVSPGPLGAELEGTVRPAHFSGVLTVVAKLFNLIRPDVAFFGEKDYQQLVLIRRMSADLDLGVEVAAAPTVRDADGLALSSRNAYLSTSERQRAVALPQALRAGRDAASQGADAVVAATHQALAEADVRVDYVALRGNDLGPAPDRGPARLLAAARVGGTRLIDNLEVVL